MKNFLIVFLFFLTGCVTTSIETESVCVSRCITVEGTILNSVTQTPLQNLMVVGSHFTPSFAISARSIKARTHTQMPMDSTQ